MLKTYNGHEVSVIVGSRLIKGLAEGDSVAVDRESDSFSDSAGLDGEVTRSGSKDKRGTVTIRLQQTSADNDFLSALSQADEKAGTGVVPLLIRDTNGTTIYASNEAWIRKPAAGSVSREAGEREWPIRCANLEMFHGGN